jgi:hypothetical protein
MSDDLKKLRAAGHRNFLVVLVLVIVTWTVPVVSAVFFLGLRY